MEINFIEWALISRSVSEALEELALSAHVRLDAKLADAYSKLKFWSELPYEIRHAHK